MILHGKLGRWVLVLMASLLGCPVVGCGFLSTTPKFEVTEVKTSHGALTARWFITIRNKGATGSQLVQFWVGDSNDQASRNVIYSERHYLGFGEQTTIEVSWNHVAVGLFASGFAYGFDNGITFLP